MSARRVRRDSETSTDSWSLVEEEDRLDDDFSVNSTEEESSDEPIVEEPPTSDEEEEEEDVTASEQSCDSDDDSTDISDSDGSDLEIQEEEEDDEDVEEEEEMSLEQREKLVREIKEDDVFWNGGVDSEDDDYEDEENDEEEEVDEEEEQWQSRRHTCRILLSFSLFLMLFPIADICTSWMLTYSATSPRTQPLTYYDAYSRQCYGRQCFREKLDEETSSEARDAVASLRLRSRSTGLRRLDSLLLHRNDHRFASSNATSSAFFGWISDLPEWSPSLASSNSSSPIELKQPSRALAPIPPAPFTPRKVRKTSVPRHQPCLVHVNESRWTCQKSSQQQQHVPAVRYSHQFFERTLRIDRKGHGKAAVVVKNKKVVSGRMQVQKAEICGKKASLSMRTVIKGSHKIVGEQQCDSRHFTKYTTTTTTQHRRKHIAFKSPLPCQAPPTYRPSAARKSTPPSSENAWSYSKRSHLRAQLRHSA